MSVEKVNKYKEEKKNRKEMVAKHKREQRRGSMIGGAIGLLLVAALVVMIALTGKNAYNNYKASQPDYNRDSYVVTDMTGILDDLTGVEEETVEEEVPAETSETE